LGDTKRCQLLLCLTELIQVRVSILPQFDGPLEFGPGGTCLAGVHFHHPHFVMATGIAGIETQHLLGRELGQIPSLQVPRILGNQLKQKQAGGRVRLSEPFFGLEQERPWINLVIL
jgi:hypothetical protein